MTRRNLIITLVLIVTPLILIGALFMRGEGSEGGFVSRISSAVGMERNYLFDDDPSTWTSSIRTLIDESRWEELADQTGRFVEGQPALAEENGIDYLHARALVEAGEHNAALDALEPHLNAGSAYRDLALHHASRALVALGRHEEASTLRRELVSDYGGSMYRDDAIEREAAWLLERDESEALSWLESIEPDVGDRWKRRVRAWQVEALMQLGRVDEAVRRGLALLDSNISDDSAESVFEALDSPPIVASLRPEQQYLLARTAHSHRHFDRAVELLRPLRGSLPSEKDQLNFLIGRAHFWNEDFEEAKTAYSYGARVAGSRAMQASFHYHASRAAQLAGDDREAEELMTRAIAVRGNFDSTAAALSQRLRTRASQKRWSDARADLALLQRLFPRGDTIVDASLAYAIHAIAADRRTEAREILNRVSTRRLDRHERAEYAYWKGRSWEGTDHLEALDDYLDVLRSEASTHYKFFVKERIETVPELQREAQAAIARRRPELDQALSEGRLADAHALQKDIVLLSGGEETEVQKLREIYEKLPTYQTIVDLEPMPLPALPLIPETAAGTSTELPEKTRAERLMALGLYDEALEDVDEIFPLNPARSALTQSKVADLAGATKPAIYAAEVMMQRVPDDYLPEALPREVMEGLYPRYFEDLIAREAEAHGADPRLLISIMREESRFDPRAKSFAAARGLLQFIITTARKIGSSIGLDDIDSEDLYDPATIIRLGGAYVGDLMEEFDGDLYRTAAAYNAGPYQAQLWSRLTPADGADYFLATVYFDETKHYVRKVLNSYKRYEELYGDDLFGGVTVERTYENESERENQRRFERSDEGERIRQDLHPPADPE